MMLLLEAPVAHSQPADCQFAQPAITIHFGSGTVGDLNSVVPPNYERLTGSCPNDGYYCYTNHTTDCFFGQWLTLSEDHTPGDASGNMMLVNSSHDAGTFLTTTIKGLKGAAIYEFAAWLMNVCKVNSPCPTLLLPNITVRLQTQEGKTVAQFRTGEIERRDAPYWKKYFAYFTMPPSETSLTLKMINNNPGGCGNDFVLDDITFRECVKPAPAITKSPKPATEIKSRPVAVKPVPKKAAPAVKESQPLVIQTVTREKDQQKYTPPVLRTRPTAFPSPPPVLTKRTNSLVKQIETETGEISINLYDNGEIDGDTVSIYHNNVLLLSRARLSQKPVSFRITIDPENPHHELIMVAENLGSIPPNTSMMIVNAGEKRYEVFISSTEQKNSKVIFDLKK